MRKLTAGLFMSVDGVAESPNLWQFDSFDAELGQMMGSVLARIDTAVLGRVGYAEWSEYWPNAASDDPFGGFINNVKKYVASTTLRGDLTWNNSTLIEGDALEFLRELKQTDGGEIGVFCSISLTRELFLAGVLDELMLMTHPVIAGSGRHLFEPGTPTTRLELVDNVTTSEGNALLTYRLRGE